jgi:hypothetical protein
VARAWSAAAAYADDDPGAAAALARCEDRMRHLHPYAMSWYDRLRSEGAGRFEAMHDALPLFARPALYRQRRGRRQGVHGRVLGRSLLKKG